MQAEREGLLAREREASRLKDEFLAAVSHELRTPLNAILGWTQILESTTPDDKTIAKAVASLSRNAQAQNRVIQDLLDVSKIITGKLQLDLQAVDLRSVVESSMEAIAPIATAKHIHLDADLPKVAARMVHADYDRSRQIVWNLLSNAVKFTPSGGSVTLRLSIEWCSYGPMNTTGRSASRGILRPQIEPGHRGPPQTGKPEAVDQGVQRPGRARPAEENDVLVRVGMHGLADDGAGILAEPGGLQARATRFGVGVGVQRQDGVADDVLDEQRQADRLEAV